MKKYSTLLILSFLVATGYSQQQTVGLQFSTGAESDGFTLFSTVSDVVYLIDNCGYVAQSWEVSNNGSGPSYLLENGDLLKLSRVGNTPFNAGGGAGLLEQYTWDNDLVWSATYSSQDFLSHHDIFALSNGNILMMAWELVSDEEAMAKGRTTMPATGLWTETILEISPVGTDDFDIVWKWRAFDHLIQDVDPALENFGVVADNPQLLDINKGPLNDRDWLHYNSIDYNVDLDQILFSSRNMNEIYIIDHSTTTEEAAGHTGGNSGKGGDYLFRWGNPFNYDQGTVQDQKLFGQHNARWINTPGSSSRNITIFNNGFGLPSGILSSAAVEIDPILDQDNNYSMADGKFLPAQLFWEYEGDPPTSFYSSRISSVQRLLNQNTIINEGENGRFFEIDFTGNIIWEYISPVVANGPVNQGTNPGNNAVFKIIKYPADDIRFQDKELSTGIPIELNPNDVDCMLSSTDTPIVSEIKYTNPVDELLTIWVESFDSNDISLITIDGKRIINLNQRGTVDLDISHLNAGLYFLMVNGKAYKLMKK
jgi:hypothetical protein